MYVKILSVYLKTIVSFQTKLCPAPLVLVP